MRTEPFHWEEQSSLAWNNGGQSGHVTLRTKYHFSLPHLSFPHMHESFCGFSFHGFGPPYSVVSSPPPGFIFTQQCVECLLGPRCRGDAGADSSAEPTDLSVPTQQGRNQVNTLHFYWLRGQQGGYLGSLNKHDSLPNLFRVPHRSDNPGNPQPVFFITYSCSSFLF